MGDTAFWPAACAYCLTPTMISGITAVPLLLYYLIILSEFWIVRGTADEVWLVTVQRVAVVNLGDIWSRLEVHSSFPLNRWKSPPLPPIWGCKEWTTTIIGGAPVGRFSTPQSCIHTMCHREMVLCLPWHRAMPVTSSPGGNGAWKRDRAPRRGSGLCCSVTRHNCIRNSDTTDGESTGTRKNGSDHWNKALHVWKCCSHSGHTHTLTTHTYKGCCANHSSCKNKTVLSSGQFFCHANTQSSLLMISKLKKTQYHRALCELKTWQKKIASRYDINHLVLP